MSDLVSTANYTFKCDRQLNHVAEKLVTLYQGKELCDTTLIAGADNIEVKTHRLVLYLSSDYFRSIFHNGLEIDKPEVIRLNMIDGETLKQVIGFMYTFEIEMSKESIEKVLSAATLFQMKTLIEGCCDLMAEQLNAINCLKFVDLAEQHNYTNLYEKSVKCAYKNFEEVSNGEEFLKLTEPQLSKFLSQDGVNVVSQETLFLSLVKWLKHDQDTREESMYILLNDFVRFAQLDTKFILENAASVAHIAKCSKLLFSWLSWHSSNEQPKKKENQINLLSWKMQKKLKIRLIYNLEVNNLPAFRVESYDPDLNKWSAEDWPQPLQMRTYHKIVITENECFIAGGWINGYTTNSVECLDLKTMKWRCLPPMLKSRYNFGMTLLNRSLYVIGGFGVNNSWTNAVEKYDIIDKKWTTLSEAPPEFGTVRRAVSLGAKLYASALGYSLLLCYEPATNTWSKTSNNISKTSFFGLAANEEYVYAVGGWDGTNTNTVQRYNPANDTWTFVKPMTIKRSEPACVAVGDTLLVFGEGNQNMFELYDEKTDEWKVLDQSLETYKNGAYISHLSAIYQ